MLLRLPWPGQAYSYSSSSINTGSALAIETATIVKGERAPLTPGTRYALPIETKSKMRMTRYRHGCAGMRSSSGCDTVSLLSFDFLDGLGSHGFDDAESGQKPRAPYTTDYRHKRK